MQSLPRLNRPIVLGAAAVAALAFAAVSSGAPPHRVPGAGKQTGPAAVAKVEPAQLLVRFATPSRAAGAVTAARDTPVAALPGGVEVVGLQRGETVASKVRQYAKRADVLYAEPNALVHASDLPDPDDPLFPQQWALQKIDAVAGWSIFPGAFGPVAATPPVAILDTGIDSTDADLADADTADGANCINALDACVGGPALDNDPIGHGTHVAGIVGAVTDNGTGVAGVAFASPLIPVKVLRSDEQGTVASVANGIRWAAGHGARVINLSLSTTAFSATLCDAVAAAAADGALVVAAAGNATTGAGGTTPNYPAACPGAVGVAMTDQNDNSPLISNIGFPNVFVSAPGVGIVSTLPRGRFGMLTGTSSSTAFVSGLAALLFGQHPERTAPDVKRVLARTSTKVGGQGLYGADPFSTCATCTWFSWFGYGRIDVEQALRGPQPIVSALTPGAGPVGTPVVVDGQDFTAASSVTFGGVSSPFTVVSSGRLTTTVPEGAAIGPVSVTTPGGTGSSTAPFAPVPAFSPDHGRGGTIVAISGPKLDDATAVRVGGVGTPFAVAGPTRLTARIGDAVASGPVTVTTPEGTYTSATAFTVDPTILRITPANGTTGTVVTVLGKALGGVQSVRVGGVAAAFTVLGPNALRLTVPAAALTGRIAVAGTSSASDFVVNPQITGITPAAAPVGAAVTIAGSGFTPATTVSFGGVAATLGSVTPNAISTTVPAGSHSGLVAVSADGSASSAFAVTPRITGFTSAAVVGDTVHVTGTNLDEATSLTVGAAAVTFTVVSAGQLDFTVPDGLATGPLTVTTPSGSYTTTDALAVLPRVTGFSPASAQTGATLTIAGTTLASATAVTIGGVAAAITGASPLTVTVPGAAVSGQVAVTTPAGTSTSDDSFSVLPHVTGFDPASGAEGATVTIDGSGFGGVTDVRFGGVSATPTPVSVNRVTAVVPPGAAGGAITVVTPAGSDASSGSFTVLPALTDVSPASGPEGTAVTLTGTSLGLVTGVDFGGVAAVGFTLVSPTQIATTVPPGAATGRVHVTTLGGTVTSPGDFTVTPAVTSLDPTSAHAGDTVTVHGTTLGDATAVTIGGVDAAFSDVQATSLVVTVPVAAVSGQVAVTTSGGVATSAGTLTILPRVTGFDPAAGPAGTIVTIAGSGLGGATGVTFGDTAATTFAAVSANSVTAVVPAGAVSGAISVATPAGSDTSSGSFTVESIAGLAPTSGAAGTAVTITGSGLDGANAVSFDGASAPVVEATATSVSTTVPADATSGHVSVTTPAGTVTSADSFTVLPHVASFDPSSGTAGTTVTIAGSGFEDVTGVKFGGVSATTFAQVSVQEVTAVVPAGAATGAVTVVTGAGSGTSADPFTVLVPIVDSFTPQSGVAGTEVTITGTHLDGATAVSFGGGSAQVDSATATAVTADVPQTAATGPISVTTPVGTATSADAFTVLPHVASFDPTSGTAGTTVTIAGSGLGGATGVTFGGVSATFAQVSVQEVTAVVPAGAATGAITVVTGAGSDTSADSFTVVVPTVDGFTPQSGVAGTEVTITGTHLDGATAVSFGGGSAQVDSATATTVAAAVPQSATTGPISVTTPAGTATSADAFTVLPHVASFDPGSISVITPAGSNDSTGPFTVVAMPADGAAAIADPFVVFPTIASIAKGEVPWEK